MDIFTEQIARKNLTSGQKILQVVVWLAGISTAIVFILMGFGAGLLAPIFLGISALTIFLAHKINRNLYIEFEYSVTNNILDVAKIVAKTHRKNLLTAKIFEFEDFGEYKPENHDKKPYQNIFITTTDDKNLYFAIFNIKGKGRTLLVFSPNNKILEAINKHLHPKLRWREEQ